jgi:probable rRNA maturation factor
MPNQQRKSKKKTKKISNGSDKKNPSVLVYFRRGTSEYVDKKLFLKQANLSFSAIKLALFPDRSGYVEVTFCLDKEIQTINREFRGKDKPTDVLSFPTDFLNDEKVPTLGDIIISVETAKRQSKNLQRELVKLFNHGLLHLLGFDHEKVTPKERKRMKYWEKKLLKLFYT